MNQAIITRERTPEEKMRRRLYGDKGAKFSGGKQYVVRTDGLANTLTSATKDNLLLEYKDE